MKTAMVHVVLFLLPFAVCAQHNTCLDSATYYTTDLGDGINQLAIPLKFKIKGDSLFIRNSSPEEKPSLLDVSFKIVEKTCRWNDDFSTGFSFYRVITNDGESSKNAVINIKANNGKGQIQLLYENAEPRIFTLKHTP